MLCLCVMCDAYVYENIVSVHHVVLYHICLCVVCLCVMHVSLCVSVQICVFMCVSLCVLCAHTCVHVHVCLFVCVCICMHMCVIYVYVGCMCAQCIVIWPACFLFLLWKQHETPQMDRVQQSPPPAKAAAAKHASDFQSPDQCSCAHLHLPQPRS